MLLTLIGRAYCHLCGEMRDAVLLAISEMDPAQRRQVSLQEVDLDDFPAMESRYEELIPVLVVGEPEEGVEICHHRFDPLRWREVMASQAHHHS
jgi:hypothetical protein